MPRGGLCGVAAASVADGGEEGVVVGDGAHVLEGYDVVLTWAIPYPVAVLGGTCRVPTLHGEDELEVPAGTGAGRAFSLRGKGIPRVDGRGRGDQHVVVTIRVPKKLTSEQKKAVQKLADVLKEESGSPTREEKGFLERLRDLFSS